MAATQQRQKRQEIATSEARKLMSHPWRVRIIEALLQRDTSCSQMVDEGVVPDLASKPRPDAISQLAYHVRLLVKADLAEIVRSIPARGSHENILRARVAAHHDDEEWAQLSLEEREAITPSTLSNLFGLAEAAAHYGSFDNRVDRHLAYVQAELDEKAWSDLGPVLNGMLDIVLRVKHEAKQRLEASGEEPIRVVWGQMMFETPPLPARPDAASPPGR